MVMTTSQLRGTLEASVRVMVLREPGQKVDCPISLAVKTASVTSTTRLDASKSVTGNRAQTSADRSTVLTTRSDETGLTTSNSKLILSNGPRLDATTTKSVPSLCVHEAGEVRPELAERVMLLSMVWVPWMPARVMTTSASIGTLSCSVTLRVLVAHGWSVLCDLVCATHRGHRTKRGADSSLSAVSSSATRPSSLFTSVTGVTSVTATQPRSAWILRLLASWQHSGLSRSTVMVYSVLASVGESSVTTSVPVVWFQSPLVAARSGPPPTATRSTATVVLVVSVPVRPMMVILVLATMSTVVENCTEMVLSVPG
mmetsp:Transcript_38638/g.95099  ORF Transcript_38638/g.95099 Transcript_38638/m.95099 type:complete len:314 (-) Transcript_38638:2926-3867(-)